MSCFNRDPNIYIFQVINIYYANNVFINFEYLFTYYMNNTTHSNIFILSHSFNDLVFAFDNDL